MLRNLFWFSIVVSLVQQSYSQVVAYDAFGFYDCFTDCTQLKEFQNKVRGFQSTFEVTYYYTFEDASNKTNPAPRTVPFVMADQIFYARVENPESNEFAISQIFYEYTGCPRFPSPPPGLFRYSICDMEGDGEIVNFTDMIQFISFYSGNDEFCEILDSNLQITYHTTLEDAQNNVNSVDQVIFVEESIELFYRYLNVSSGATFIYCFGVDLIPCVEDQDNDGVPDFQEHSYGNFAFIGDDTDKDGIPNHLDEDDDNDGILTIDEDYNGNGNPRDDDTNNNDFADYLENNVTLHYESNLISKFRVFPNPVKHQFRITMENMKLHGVELFNTNGKLVKTEFLDSEENEIIINIADLNAGLYFLKVLGDSNIEIKKLIIH